MAKEVWCAETSEYTISQRTVLYSSPMDMWREEGQVVGKWIFRESYSQAVIDLCNAIDEEVVRLMEIKNNLQGS